jgi:hypothetical protein
MLSALLLTSVATVTIGSVVLVDAGEITLESVMLTVAGTAVSTAVFDVLVAAVAGAHAASTTILIVITRLKSFFWFISFLHF